jgi:hypothetical protein
MRELATLKIRNRSQWRRCGCKSASVLASVVARLGVADVRAFGLTWEDCEQLLKQLGFSARVAIVAE